FEVVFIFSDRGDGACRGEGIACDRGIPYFSHDIRAFHRLRGVKRDVSTPEGLAARKEFDRTAARLVRAFEVDAIALGGYMSYTTLERCINVHPADLSILTREGRRRYVGDRAVMDAIAAGETHLRASTIWTDEGVDTGPLLMVSAPVRVELPMPLEALRQDPEKFVRVADDHQQRLKERGDWKIFPQTVEMIARGRFALDGEGRVYVDGRAVPGGYREEDDGENIE
ncbi:MAG: formyl transferase, partial [Deltaproteobacteria bacterium]|nr:formyl transferase [Deltaproteobacteria bacterium]